MTDPHLRTRIEFLDPSSIRLTETATPEVSPEELLAMDRIWEAEIARSPHLFDGPLVTCVGLEWQQRELVLSWARATYRHRALRRLRGYGGWRPSSVFVTVLQPTDTGELVVGRGSASTAAPGRWQLPGGSAEPPAGDGPLDLLVLRRHAARELVEEIGIDIPSECLSSWAVTRGGNGNIGFHFLAPPRSAASLRERFAALVAAERASGREPELDRIVLIRSRTDLADLGGPHVDYLTAVTDRYAEQ
ncbi:NUDIX hydrolase [Streptomyces sp. NPDC058701]|uniref:NUDIX hydrolase n=1 Tax=Streptomyces sp. NPDC058701 TaxID=3346608 RepID=UPI003662F75B